MAYRSSWARGWIRAAGAGLCHSRSNARSKLCLQPTLHLKAILDPLTHWVKPGVEPESSWILVEFLTCWATPGIPFFLILYSHNCCSLLLGEHSCFAKFLQSPHPSGLYKSDRLRRQDTHHLASMEHFFVFVFLGFVCLFVLLGPHPRHMEVLRLGAQSEL